MPKESKLELKVGLFMLVALAGAGNGLENGINKQIEGFATNAAFVWSEPTTVAYKGFKKGRSCNFVNDDKKVILQNTRMYIISQGKPTYS